MRLLIKVIFLFSYLMATPTLVSIPYTIGLIHRLRNIVYSNNHTLIKQTLLELKQKNSLDLFLALDEYGETALHWSARMGNIDLIYNLVCHTTLNLLSLNQKLQKPIDIAIEWCTYYAGKQEDIWRYQVVIQYLHQEEQSAMQYGNLIVLDLI